MAAAAARRRRAWRRAARRELEGADARAPRRRAGGLDVLGRVPEGAVVDRVDGHARVVAPAVRGAGLRARAGKELLLGAERAGRVGREARRVRNARIVRRSPVRRRSSPTAMSPLLSIAADGIQRLSPSARRERPWSCICQAPVPIFSMLYQRAPARSLPTSTEMARDERLPAAEVAVLRTPHPAIGERLQLDGRPGLRMHAPKSHRFSSYGAAWTSVSCVIVIDGVPDQSTVAFVIWI